VAAKRRLHPIFIWLWGARFAAQLLRWGDLVLAGLFWPGVALIYAGFILLVVDVWLEPKLPSFLKSKIALSLILAAFTAIFSWGIVFVKAPLDIAAFVTVPEGNVYTPRPTSSDWLMSEGTYIVAQRTRTIAKKIPIGGNLIITNWK
jgi:hypothetical protein